MPDPATRVLLTHLAISGYRSLRDVRLGLDRLNVVTGANGSGKSSLYRALRLIADIAQGRIVQSLAAEGGLPSTLWAGPETISRAMRQGHHPVQGTRRKEPVSLKLGFAAADYGYAIDLGLPPQTPGDPSFFLKDPHIKVESLWAGPLLGRSNEFARRDGASVRLRDGQGAWRNVVTQAFPSFDSMIAQCGDPREAPEVFLLRERLRDWRFYDHLRTDADAPARRRQIGTYTPVLAADGANLAAAIQTIVEIGDFDAFSETIEDAFPGSQVRVSVSDGFFEIVMTQPGLLRPLRTAELSDGTLRFLLLAAALLSSRPPELMILNEPETSLHPDLLAPLGRLIVQAAQRSQMIVVTHAAALVAALEASGPVHRIVLEKELGETIVRDRDPAPWVWPAR